MMGSDRAGRDEAGPLTPGSRRDWLWVVGLLIGLGGVSWLFDRALDLL
jgi:hypothetical protein